MFPKADPGSVAAVAAVIGSLAVFGAAALLDLEELALARLPEAIATLFQGNRDALAGFTHEEIAQLITLLDRLITNLDRLTVAH